MTVTTEKRTTFEQLEAIAAAMFAKRRNTEHYDPQSVTGKMKELEDILLPFVGKKATDDWVFNGFDIDADKDAASLWPITASLKFNHRTLRGFDEAQAWGQSGSEECHEWLQGLGFPVYEVDLTME